MKKLDIDNCIIKSDVSKIKKEPPLKKIKTKRRLSKEIDKKKLIKGATESAIYTKLWRLEKDGYEAEKEPTDIIEAILEVLNSGLDEQDEKVSKSDLIKEL